jgi:hypothetical protein
MVFTNCVFPRQFWFPLLRYFGLQTLVPLLNDDSFDDCRRRTNEMVDEQFQQGINSLIILGAWPFWKHRNQCVFDVIAADMYSALLRGGSASGDGWCERNLFVGPCP